MIPADQMGRLLHQSLHEEADAVRIDSVRAARHFERYVAGAPRMRWLRGVLTAAAAVLAIVVGWAALSGTGGAGTASPRLSGAQLSVARSAAPMPIDSTWPYLLDLDTGAQTPLPWRFVPRASGLRTVYALDPTTGQVALSHCLQPSSECGQSMVLVGRVDDPGVRHISLPSGLVSVGVEWSPDGRQLLISATDGSAAAVPESYVHDLATGRTTKISDIPLDFAWWYSLQSSFSGDGRSVLYDLPRGRGQSASWDVWTVPATGGPARVLIRNAKSPRGIPGTSDIAFLSPIPAHAPPRRAQRAPLHRGDGSAIVVARGTGAYRTIVAAVTAIGVIQVSPDGTRLAYEDDGSAWVVDLGARRTERVAAGTPAGWLDDHTLLILP